MTDETVFLKSKCPVCKKGQLGIRYMIKNGLPDLLCAHPDCGKLFRAFEKDIANNRYMVYLIDQYGISRGKAFEVEI
jgi:hypothetical protein